MVLAVLSVVTACSGDEAANCSGVLVAGACQTACRSEKCAAGHVCINNACSAPCQSHADCDRNRYCVGISAADGGVSTHCACLTRVEGGKCLEQAGRCDDAACPPGWRCIFNACTPPCKNHDDCPVGKHCMLAVLGDGTQGKFCGPAPFAQDGGVGQNAPCTSDAECDVPRGWHCIGNTCRLKCTLHTDCGRTGVCSGELAGPDGKIHWCEPDGLPRGPGQFGASCSAGPEACDEQAGFVCIGAAAGDLDAYCTKSGCTADSECPRGHFCSLVRSGRAPCESACGLAASPEAGCVPSTEIGDGKPFRCGQIGLLRQLCLKREFCSECQTDADCLAVPNQICAKDISGAKICTVPCDFALDSCPWGNAAVCDVWDTERGIPTCSHRFRSCTGTGQNCEPCVDENDCGQNGLCVTTGFTGERFCIDLDLTCAGCSDGVPLCINAGCPDTPGGLPGQCLNDPASRLHRKCYGANVNSNPLGSPQIGCWP